jgi:Helix-turn-helix
MNSLARLNSESSATGELPPEAKTPESGQTVHWCCFDIPAARPLVGGVHIDAVVEEFARDPEMAHLLGEARRRLSPHLDGTETPRALRLLAGFSQDELASRSGTTQSYIAKMEAGRLDPGTDMIDRIASGLSIDSARLFSAIRAQRNINATAA